MKTQFALLGCLMLAWNVASANVDCAKAPYGESVAQYGRDEFQLGIIAMMHNNKHPAIPQAMIGRISKEMRAACLAKFYGTNLTRYAALGLSPDSIKTQSVGSIAAKTVQWNGPHARASGKTLEAASASSAPTGSVSIKQSTGVQRAQNLPTPIKSDDYRTVTSSFPACPRKADIERLLRAALIDAADWPNAEARAKKHGCIELHPGDRVYLLRGGKWIGLTQVRPEGHARAYWTDAQAVK